MNIIKILFIVSAKFGMNGNELLCRNLRQATVGRLHGFATTAEHNAEAEQEAEIIPPTVIMHLVDIDAVREKRADECEWRDHSVPQTKPESSNISICCDCMDGGVRASGTASQGKDTKNEKHEMQYIFLAHCGLLFVDKILRHKNKPSSRSYFLGGQVSLFVSSSIFFIMAIASIIQIYF